MKWVEKSVPPRAAGMGSVCLLDVTIQLLVMVESVLLLIVSVPLVVVESVVLLVVIILLAVVVCVALS